MAFATSCGIVAHPCVAFPVQSLQEALERLNCGWLDIPVILSLLQPVGFERVLRQVFLRHQPVEKCIDVLKRLIIAGRRGIRDSCKLPQRVLFQWFIGNAVLAMLQKIRKAIPIVPHRQFPGVLRLLYKQELFLQILQSRNFFTHISHSHCLSSKFADLCP